MAEKITAREVDYSQWYIDIILNAKLADYSPVKGSMVIRPRGYAIWEKSAMNSIGVLRKPATKTPISPSSSQ